MRATLRLITVWVGVTVVIVVLGWSGLRSAVIAAIHGDTNGYSTLDPSALGHRPGTARPDGGGFVPRPLPLPSRRPAPRSPPAVTVPPVRPPAASPVAPPIPSAAAPSPTPSPPAPVSRQPEPQPSPDETTKVETDGGTVVLRVAGGAITVEAYVAAEGFTARAVETYQDALTFEFTSADHVSTVHAYLDKDGAPIVSVTEESLR